MEFLSPGVLNTPSLTTPIINLSAPSFKTTAYNPLSHIIADNDHATNNSTTSLSSSTTVSGESSSSASMCSADVKVSKIEDELKQSFSEPRQPTASPFQKIATSSVGLILLEKNGHVEDGIPIEPSTADVVSDIESFTTLKFPSKTTIDSIEAANQLREATMGYDSSPPTTNMVVSISPKKKLLYRSQSQTEPTSPTSIHTQANNNNNNHSQSQSAQQQQFLPQRIINTDNNSNLSSQNDGLDDDSSMDDEQIQSTSSVAHHFTRAVQELTYGTENNPNQRIKIPIDEQALLIHLQADQNGLMTNLPKQQQQQQTQTILPNTKRNYQQAFTIGNPTGLIKPTSTIIPQLPMSNEVTSSVQTLAIKRQKPIGLSTNDSIGGYRPTIAPTNIGGGVNNAGGGIVTEDQRKKQIRDSNREAARRCRERRRHHIEQLEGNLEGSKLQMKQLMDKLARSERENTQLRAIISEIMQRLQPSTRLSLTERIGDLANVVATVSNGLMDSNEFSQQSDGGTTRVYTNNDSL